MYMVKDNTAVRVHHDLFLSRLMHNLISVACMNAMTDLGHGGAPWTSG